jgi:uncharacterized protein
MELRSEGLAGRPLRWRPGVAEKLHFYVYVLIDPRNGKPFYVGKGVGDRCFAHISEAHKTTRDSVGDYPKLKTIRDIESHDAVWIELLRWGLEGPEGEQTAFAIEAAVIDLLRLDLDNRASGLARGKGRISAQEADIRLGAFPATFDPSHKVMLVRVARQFEVGMDDTALYKATRQWWRVGSDRRRPGTTRSPQWAMAVYRGVVRAVYRIERWRQPTSREIRASATIEGRWAFVGKVDSDMMERYFGGDVTDQLPLAAQNPIRFVNCD